MVFWLASDPSDKQAFKGRACSKQSLVFGENKLVVGRRQIKIMPDRRGAVDEVACRYKHCFAAEHVFYHWLAHDELLVGGYDDILLQPEVGRS